MFQLMLNSYESDAAQGGGSDGEAPDGRIILAWGKMEAKLGYARVLIGLFCSFVGLFCRVRRRRMAEALRRGEREKRGAGMPALVGLFCVICRSLLFDTQVSFASSVGLWPCEGPKYMCVCVCVCV